MTTPPLSHLDTLLLQYLDTLDVYQTHAKSLTALFSAGFLALAQANYHARPGVRYGKDLYDARMGATRGVGIDVGIDGEAVFEERNIAEAEGEGEVEKDSKPEDEVESGGVRRRKKGTADKEDAVSKENGNEKDEQVEKDRRDVNAEGSTEEGEKEKGKVNMRDPIRMFGILVPPALRTAQSEFSGCIPILTAIASTLSSLSRLEAQIKHHRRAQAVYKILTASPPSSPSEPVPPTPLDKESGFMHLCAAAQIPGVVGRFMSDCEKLWVLKVSYDKIAEDLKWEEVGRDGEEFPHLFGELKGSDVVKVSVLERGDGWEQVFADEERRKEYE